jgi:LacI family transcriptional regulator
MPEPRVTLQDLADHLNLSRAAVSLALRGAGRIAPETRERVRQAARELGYHPDPLLSAFSRRRQQSAAPGSVLALITRNPVNFAQQHLEQSARRLGYRLENFAWNSHSSESALVRVLQSRGLAGVLFPETADPLSLTNSLWSRFRGVYCGPYPEGGEENCPFDVVRHNPFDAMTLAWRKAINCGAKRVGLLLPLNSQGLSTLDRKALASFKHWQEEASAARTTPLLAQFSQLRVRNRAIRDWMREQQPDLVIGGSYPVHHFLRNCGYRIPEDVRFIALRLRREDPSVAGVLIDVQSTALRALHHLHAIIQHGHEMDSAETTTLVLNATWRDGASCRMPVGS